MLYIETLHTVECSVMVCGQTRRAMQRSIWACSCSHYCSGKVISSAYCECVFVAVGIQRAFRVRQVVICGLPGCALLSHIISWTPGFSKESYWTQKCVFWFPLQLCGQQFSFWEEMSEIWSKMYIGLRVKYRLLLSNFHETWIFSWDFFQKYSNIIFN